MTLIRPSPPGDKLAVGGEELDAVVARVGHVDRAVAGRGHALRGTELPCATALAAPLVQELPPALNCWTWLLPQSIT